MNRCGRCHGSTLAAFLLGGLLLQLPQVDAEWALPQASTCPLGDLMVRMEGVQKACCVQGGEQVCASGGAPGPCSLDCAATFVPLSAPARGGSAALVSLSIFL